MVLPSPFVPFSLLVGAAHKFFSWQIPKYPRLVNVLTILFKQCFSFQLTLIGNFKVVKQIPPILPKKCTELLMFHNTLSHRKFYL